MQKPIRILHVLGRLDRGGAETMIVNIYRNIDRSKVQFDFVIHTEEKCDYDDEIRKLGGKIFSIPRYTGKNHFSYKKAWHTFFINHPEYKLIHGHMRSTAGIYLKVAKKHGLITIAHSHSTASRGNKIEQLAKNIMQLPIRYLSDYLFACSDEAGKWLFGKDVNKRDNYSIIKNAIDVEKYTFNETIRNEIRKNLGIENKFVLGHIGSFTFPKNHKFIIEIFDEIRKINSNTVLLLLGEGELRPQIEKQVEDLGIKDKVILTGTVPNVHEYLQAMDVFLFPSIFEGLGMAVIEAQAAGLPCVISDAVPDEAIVTDKVNIIPLNKQQSSIQWANAIINIDIYNRREDTSRSLIEHGYDIKSEVEKVKNIYFDILKPKEKYEGDSQ